MVEASCKYISPEFIYSTVQLIDLGKGRGGRRTPRPPQLALSGCLP